MARKPVIKPGDVPLWRPLARYEAWKAAKKRSARSRRGAATKAAKRPGGAKPPPAKRKKTKKTTKKFSWQWLPWNGKKSKTKKAAPAAGGTTMGTFLKWLFLTPLALFEVWLLLGSHLASWTGTQQLSPDVVYMHLVDLEDGTPKPGARLKNVDPDHPEPWDQTNAAGWSLKDYEGRKCILAKAIAGANPGDVDIRVRALQAGMEFSRDGTTFHVYDWTVTAETLMTGGWFERPLAIDQSRVFCFGRDVIPW